MRNSIVSPERRALLKLAAATAAGLCLPAGARAQPRLAHDPFALGVASGSPRHDSVVLWTRLVDNASSDKGLADRISVRWQVANDDKFARVVQSGEATALRELAHSIHVEVEGLEPDRWYHYRFLAGGAESPTGRTRTFPAPGAEAARLRLAYASCQRWEHGYFNAHRHMRDENLDAVVFLGDYIYEYSSKTNVVRVPTGGPVLTLDDYRRRYVLHRSDPDLRAMHAVCPWLCAWDDHEVQNDYAGLRAGDGIPAPSSFAERRAAAYQAYYEHMPLRAAVLTRAVAGLASGAEMRLYAQVPFGRLATLYLLDDRQYRDRQVCTVEGKGASSTVEASTCAQWNDPARTLLGAEQERWLDAAFDGTRATWNVIGMQTLFGQRNFLSRSSLLLWNDGWDGYPAARTRLIASMRKHGLANPVLLGGDVHQNWVGHVKADYADPASAAIGVEFCGTSITARSDSAHVARVLAENPHFVFADGEKRGYGVVELTPKRLTATLRAVADVTSPETSIDTLARFSVEAGRPAIERA